ncbi:MAG: insulinase family protein [Oligoflexia bacterium]|nr:insulinase family protein [Oligoflexia bacterium]
MKIMIIMRVVSSFSMCLLCLLFLYSCSHMYTNKTNKKDAEKSSEKNAKVNMNEIEEIMSSVSDANKMKEAKADANIEKVNLDIRKFVLKKNGLTILLAENHHLPIVSYYTYFKVGSRYEGKGMSGATHFLEHLMFKGAKKYGPQQFDSIMEENGGRSNAYTSTDSTVYHQAIPSAALETVLDLESDRMENLLLEEKAFEKEKSVILEERKLRYDNSPTGKLFQKMTEIMYKGTPYGIPVIGYVDDIVNVQRDDIKKYFNKFYAPNNAVLVIIGDIDIKKTLDLVNKYYGNIPSSKQVEKTKALLDNDDLYKFQGKSMPAEAENIKINANSNTPIFYIAYRGEKIGTKRYYVMDILASIFSAGASSYLVKKYVTGDTPTLNSISLYNYSFAKNGLYLIAGELLNETKLEDFKNSWDKNQVNFCKEAISDHTVQKTKNQYMVAFFSALETNEGVAELVGNSEFYFNDHKYYKKELQELNSITTKDVMDVCKEIFSGQKYGFFSVWEKHPK